MVEEYIYELVRAIGDMHSAIQDGVGNESTPKTALFELYQLEQLTSNQLPAFGILESNPDGFIGSYDSAIDKYFVNFSSGEVGYNGQRLVIPAQKIAIRRVFSDTYGAGYIYGIRVGFSLAEAEKSTQSYSTTTSASTLANATELPVNNIALVESLGFPISAHVNNVFVRFSGINSDGTALVVDAGYDNGVGLVTDPLRFGRISTAISSGSPVYFIYEPKLSVLYGLPVVHGGTNPETFHYFPPMPDTWLPIADMLAGTPEDPELTEDAGEPVITRTVQAYPTPDSTSPIFDTADASTISRATKQTRIALRQSRDNASLANMISAMEEYTAQVADSSEQDFRQYWASRSFKPTSYFARGVSFAGLERFNFPSKFAQAYYDVRGVDVQHTFAVFRGDLFDYSYGIVGDAPANVNVSSYVYDNVYWSGESFSMGRGTYIYGVSAVTNNGETPVTYASTTASYSSQSYFVNHIEFDEVTDALFYHIYRRSNITGDQIDYRLTSVGEVSGYGSHTMPVLTYDTTRTMSSAYEAIKFTASGTLLQGIRVQVQTSATITNPLSYLSFSIYSDNAGVPGSLVSTITETVEYGDLSAVTKTLLLKCQATLTDGNSYWLVMHQSSAPTGGTIKFIASSATVTAKYATATTLPTWSTVNNLTAYIHPMYGYIDSGVTGQSITQRGIKLTGDIALEPRRLRVYVPPVETNSLIRGRDPVVAFNGDDTYDLSDPENSPTKNELVVTITARSGSNGTPQTFTVTVPQNTVRGTEFLIGSELDLFDRVDEVLITPGSDLSMDANYRIAWSLYDFVTVETVP